jgi:hypothetical protein
MKAFRTPIVKGFSEQAIRAADVTTRNSGLLISCKQARIQKAGLEGYTPDVNDILLTGRKFYDSVTAAEITITRRWPFPQIFLTDVGVFIGALSGLYRITDPAPDEYPDIILVDYSSGATVWPWSCIPIPGYPAFTSGTKFVYYDSNATSYVVVS